MERESRYYTSVEQSQKLIEMGLDPNTADMCYIKHCTSDDQTWRYDDFPPMVLSKEMPDSIDCLPCWSVGALFAILRQVSLGNKMRKKGCALDIFMNGISCGKGIDYDIIADYKFNDGMADSFYKMVVLMLEKKFI